MAQFAEQYMSFINKLMPKKAARPGIGLDIGISSCRMIELIKRPDGPELLKWAIEPIVSGDVVKAVKNCIAKASQPHLQIYTALTGKGTLIRFVEMPVMSLEELKQSFAFEVDKYFPFPKDQIFTDCHILPSEKKDNKLQVLVAAAKKELVNERMKVFTDAALHPDFVTLNSIAIANVFDVLGDVSAAQNADPTKGPRVTAVLDIGEVVSNLTIFVDGVPQFNRDIFVGGRDFTKAISSSLKLSYDEAEKVKITPDAKTAEIAAIIDHLTVDLVSELRLSLDYFVTEKNINIQQLCLTGGSSSLKDLPVNLAKHLELPVNLWNPFEKVKLGPGVNAEELKSKVPLLGSALGLALYA